MKQAWADGRARRGALLALDLAVRAAIVFWLAEAWVMQDDPRFAGKAIPERNTVIVGSLSLLLPAIWLFRGLDWRSYPLGLDVLYLSIYALDMGGNSFDLYDSYAHFDLIPHFHSTGAASLLVAVYWARTRHADAVRRPTSGWLLETTLVAAGAATMVHVALDAQEHYTDVLAGTVNVRGVSDTVNDLAVGLAGALIYPPLAVRWFLGRPHVGWRGAATVAVLAALAAAALTAPGPRIADAIADRFATDPPAGGLPAAVRAELMAAAGARALAPPPSATEVRHAHDGVTVDDLRAASAGGYHSVEGDVGLHGRVAVMRHDPRDPVAITFREWLDVVSAARFTIVKVDVKRDRIGPIVDDIRAAIGTSGLDECRLKLNADVLDGPGAYADLTLRERLYTRVALKLEPADLVTLGRAFPCAAVSIGAWTGPVPEGTRYGERDIRGVLSLAADLRAAGTKRVVVAARWDLLSDEFVGAMSAAGIRVDVWNSTSVRSPADPAVESGLLRSRYGDALDVIDLRK